MFKILLNKSVFVTSVVQTACFGHIVFEYLSDIVVVNLFQLDPYNQIINKVLKNCPQTNGPSMEPTLETNSILLTDRISKRFQWYDRGDIVIAKSPIEPQILICKRVVGLPGDKISMKPRINLNPFGTSKSEVNSDTFKELMSYMDSDEDGAFDVDKSKHIDNQDSSMRTFHSKMVIVPKGHLWLEGDNSDNSIDSRTYGPVPMGLIQSRAAFRLYPDPDVF